MTKDVCLDCRKKIIKLLQLVPNANFEEDNKSMSITW